MVVQISSQFYGCYLLYCLNPKYKGRTYIGFTVDPQRRIKQHNKGAKSGGAYRTSGKGPWDMVLIIYGFPNEISALRFEWAWQHPTSSRRLQHVSAKKKSETKFNYCVRVMSNMLAVGPWNRLALTIRWLNQDYQVNFDPGLEPPKHMPIVFGPVARTKRGKGGKKGGSSDPHEEESKEEEKEHLTEVTRCEICRVRLETRTGADTVECLQPDCPMVAHALCLAKQFLEQEANRLVPVEGGCPRCHVLLLWSDLMCDKSEPQMTQNGEDGEDSHWTQELRDTQITSTQS